MVDNQKERRKRESKLVDRIFPGGVMTGNFNCFFHGGQFHIYTRTFWTMYKDHVGTFDSNTNPKEPLFICYSEAHRPFVEDFVLQYEEQFEVEVKVEYRQR